MRRLDRFFATAMRGLCLGCLLLLFAIVTLSVLNRFIAFTSMGWADELIELLFAWVLFIGAACLWREQAHFRVDLLSHTLRGTRRGRLLDVAVCLASIVLLAVFTWQSWQLAMNASDDSPVFALSKKYWYGVMPVAGVIMLGYSLRDLWSSARGQSAPVQET